MISAPETRIKVHRERAVWSFAEKQTLGVDWQLGADNSETVLKIPRREALKELGISDSAVCEKVFLLSCPLPYYIFCWQKIALQNVKLV